LTRRELQPGGLPESHAVRRATARAADDPGTPERRVPALRAGASQHIYQWTCSINPHAPTARTPTYFLRRTDLGRRRIRGVCRYWTGRGIGCGGTGGPGIGAYLPARNRGGIAVRLCVGR